MSHNEVRTAALKLPPKRRAKLAEQLLDSLGEQNQKKIDAAWAREVEARIDSYEQGKSRSKPLEQVLRKHNSD